MNLKALIFCKNLGEGGGFAAEKTDRRQVCFFVPLAQKNTPASKETPPPPKAAASHLSFYDFFHQHSVCPPMHTARGGLFCPTPAVRPVVDKGVKVEKEDPVGMFFVVIRAFDCKKL